MWLPISSQSAARARAVWKLVRGVKRRERGKVLLKKANTNKQKQSNLHPAACIFVEEEPPGACRPLQCLRREEAVKERSHMDESVGKVVLETQIQRRWADKIRRRPGKDKTAKSRPIPVVGLWTFVQPQRNIARQSEEALDVCPPDIVRLVDARHLVDHHLQCATSTMMHQWGMYNLKAMHRSLYYRRPPYHDSVGGLSNALNVGSLLLCRLVEASARRHDGHARACGLADALSGDWGFEQG